MVDLEALRARLAEHGQSHLLQHWEKLDEAQKKELYDDLMDIDLAEMTEAFQKATHPERSSSSLDERMVPIEDKYCASVNDSSPEDMEGYRKVALEAVSRGQVGVLLLAGGQGTRLGVAYPKGMYDLQLPSGKSLYQIQVERILRLEEMAFQQTGNRGSIRMYIMTSEHTKAPTAAFFAKSGYFGMKKENVVLFEQRMIPCFDFEGKIILGSPSKISRAPDGNGGLYWALKQEGILEDFTTHGVEYTHAYCVDNILVKVADPVFMGYCIQNRADCANKVLEKAFPSEAVGVVCKVDGLIQVVEYSEIGKATSELRCPDGKLTYCAGNICNHFFTTEFLRAVCDHHHALMTIHVAKKKIPYVDQDLQTITPKEPNGIKLEKFVFDVFQFSKSFLVWECLRESEFSPLKNADGPGKKDTPKTAREALLSLHKTYVENAGGRIVLTDEGVPSVEISPLLSYEGENLAASVKGKTFSGSVVLKEEAATADEVTTSTNGHKNGHSNGH